jgi:hypothetical protein
MSTEKLKGSGEHDKKQNAHFEHFSKTNAHLEHLLFWFRLICHGQIEMSTAICLLALNSMCLCLCLCLCHAPFADGCKRALCLPTASVSSACMRARAGVSGMWYGKYMHRPKPYNVCVYMVCGPHTTYHIPHTTYHIPHTDMHAHMLIFMHASSCRKETTSTHTTHAT